MPYPSWSPLVVRRFVAAQVTQPSGLVTPRGSANGETQLHSLFSARGEVIDFVADGAHARARPASREALSPAFVIGLRRGPRARFDRMSG